MDGSVVTYIRVKEAAEQPVFTQRHIKVANKAYQADGIFYGADQEKLFETISKAILEKALQGYNCTIFAYGQTGSGKTYTMQGSEEAAGIIPRTLGYLHERCENIRISFIEIYNESMTDLLAPANQLSMREDPTEGVVVDNLCITPVSDMQKSLELYSIGAQNRRCAATKMNENSSRSHTIFTIYLEIKENNLIRRSRLCLVDLAGSERLKDNEPERTKETCNINKSLLCLGKIVNKLNSKDRWHVSYRDSKLTFLLKDSLGGNCRLAIIGTVCLEYESETINTLLFLGGSKMMRNKPSINYDIKNYTTSELAEGLRLLGEENQELRSELHRIEHEGRHAASASTLYSLQKLEEEMLELKKSYHSLKSIFLDSLGQYFEANRLQLNKVVKCLAEKKENDVESCKRPKNKQN